jgi:hypothetical protein
MCLFRLLFSSLHLLPPFFFAPFFFMSLQPRSFLLQPSAMRNFIDSYMPNPHCRSHEDASPLLGSSSSLVPPAPALIVLCQCDLLQAEGLAYAHKLRAEGGDVQVARRPSLKRAGVCSPAIFISLVLQVVQVQGAPHGALNFQGTHAGKNSPRVTQLRPSCCVPITCDCISGAAIVREASLWIHKLLDQMKSTPVAIESCRPKVPNAVLRTHVELTRRGLRMLRRIHPAHSAHLCDTFDASGHSHPVELSMFWHSRRLLSLLWFIIGAPDLQHAASLISANCPTQLHNISQ